VLKQRRRHTPKYLQLSESGTLTPQRNDNCDCNNICTGLIIITMAPDMFMLGI